MYDSRNLPDFTPATIDKRIQEILDKTKLEVKKTEEIKKENREPQIPEEPINTK